MAVSWHSGVCRVRSSCNQISLVESYLGHKSMAFVSDSVNDFLFCDSSITKGLNCLVRSRQKCRQKM